MPGVVAMTERARIISSDPNCEEFKVAFLGMHGERAAAAATELKEFQPAIRINEHSLVVSR